MIPYGKDSWRRNSDTARGEWLAARGFALCRLDVRGTGSSPGVALDEYTEAETLDGYDAVEWLAAQPWCTGAVGMWGISYGGFTSIQVAKLRPPHLRAILPMYATDDRYRDDVHIRGGCVTASEKSQYAVSQLGMNAMPPRPGLRGDGWQHEWRARLEADPAMAHVAGSASRRTGRTGGAARSRPTTTRSTARCSRSRAGPTRTWTRRSGSRSGAGTRPSGRSWATGCTPSPTTPSQARTSTGSTSSSGSSTATSRAIDNGWEHEPALVWFEHEYADPEPFPAAWPGRWRAAGSLPGARDDAARACAGHGCADRQGNAPCGRHRWRRGLGDQWRRGRRRHRPPGDRAVRRARSPGAPAAPPTASPATCGRTSCTA